MPGRGNCIFFAVVQKEGCRDDGSVRRGQLRSKRAVGAALRRIEWRTLGGSRVCEEMELGVHWVANIGELPEPAMCGSIGARCLSTPGEVQGRGRSWVHAHAQAGRGRLTGGMPCGVQHIRV